MEATSDKAPYRTCRATRLPTTVQASAPFCALMWPSRAGRGDQAERSEANSGRRAQQAEDPPQAGPQREHADPPPGCALAPSKSAGRPTPRVRGRHGACRPAAKPAAEPHAP
jgi:hypothetical protein